MPQIWDDHPFLKAVRAVFPVEDAAFDDTDLRDLDRVLTACCMVIDEPDRCYPHEVLALLTGLKNGYTDWLGHTRDAIFDAELEELDRAKLYGAFCMAKTIIFTIEHPRKS